MMNIEKYLNSIEKFAYFLGAVLIEKEGKIVLKKGCKNPVDAVFQIGSLTKQFTAAAILELGLDLDTSIAEFLPECKWREVTLRHLLTHSSGIPNYTEEHSYFKAGAKNSCDKLIQWALKQKLEFRPGSEQQYCNTGYLLLGVIIEKVTQKTYPEFIQESLLQPAKMNSSGVYTGKRVEGRAVGYCFDKRGEKLVEDRSENIAATLSDGAIYSTIDDFNNWCHVLDGEPEILSKKTRDLMMEGMGLETGKSYGKKMVFHSGQVAGYNADFCHFPDARINIIVFGNNVHFNAQAVTGKICQALLGNKELPEVIPFPSDYDFSPFEYALESDVSRDFKVSFFLSRRGELFLDGPMPTRCHLLSNGRLFNPFFGVEYEIRHEGIVVYDSFDNEIDFLS